VSDAELRSCGFTLLAALLFASISQFVAKSFLSARLVLFFVLSDHCFVGYDGSREACQNEGTLFKHDLFCFSFL